MATWQEMLDADYNPVNTVRERYEKQLADAQSANIKRMQAANPGFGQGGMSQSSIQQQYTPYSYEPTNQESWLETQLSLSNQAMTDAGFGPTTPTAPTAADPFSGGINTGGGGGEGNTGNTGGYNGVTGTAAGEMSMTPFGAFMAATDPFAAAIIGSQIATNNAAVAVNDAEIATFDATGMSDADLDAAIAAGLTSLSDENQQDLFGEFGVADANTNVGMLGGGGGPDGTGPGGPTGISGGAGNLGGQQSTSSSSGGGGMASDSHGNSGATASGDVGDGTRGGDGGNSGGVGGEGGDGGSSF